MDYLWKKESESVDAVYVDLFATIPFNLAETTSNKIEQMKTPESHQLNELNRIEYCLTCEKTDGNFIKCDNCSDVHFCNRECQQRNTIHQWECNSIFHRIENYIVKLAMQMALLAIDIFPNVVRLMGFVEGVLAESRTQAIGIVNDRKSKYRFLLLLSKSQEDNIDLAYEVYCCLMSLPKIEALFCSAEKQRFLMHLVLHHMAIIPMNSFREEKVLSSGDKMRIKCIHDIFSLFNHSCVPNAFYFNRGNAGYCITIHPIRKDDQIYINYLGNQVTQSYKFRQNYMTEYWGFTCKCDRCEPTVQRDILKEMKDDLIWKYIFSHYCDWKLPLGEVRHNRLIDECKIFLRKYGHIYSDTLDSVTNCFLLATFQNNL